MTLLQVCEWLESTSVAMFVQQSPWGFPSVVAFHLLGLTLSVGLVAWFDLRLLGIVLPACPVSVVYRRVMPLAFAGFALMFVTGGLLFVSYATSAYGNVYFQIKMGALVLAGVNATIYHLRTERRFAREDTAAHQPLQARMAGLLSILAWTTVIIAGRMMSYTMF